MFLFEFIERQWVQTDFSCLADNNNTKRIVELEGLIDKAKRDVESLQKRIRNERQLNRKMDLNGAARGIKKQIAQWQSEFQETKFVNSDKNIQYSEQLK